MKSPDILTTQTTQGRPFRILFVCLGNICRSPAAQGVMESIIRDSSLETQFQVDSAGTASYHIGRLPDNRMIAAAARRGYKLTSLAKELTKTHVADRQLVLAMDQGNYAEIVRISVAGTNQVGHIRMLSDFLDETWPCDVPDPYHGGESGFEFVLDMLETACPNILSKCKQWTSI